MMKEYQVTLICTTGQYRPVSCIVKADTEEMLKEGSIFIKAVQKKGIIKICQKRLWTSSDLKRYGYTQVKVRQYDKERIEQENKERYERIKEEKYNSGEWKRPKEKTE